MGSYPPGQKPKKNQEDSQHNQQNTSPPSRLIPGPASGCHFLLCYFDNLFCTFLGGCYFLLHFLDSPFCTLFDAFSKRFLIGSIFWKIGRASCRESVEL